MNAPPWILAAGWRLPVLLFASIAAGMIGGCRAEPADLRSRTRQADPVGPAEPNGRQAAQPSQPQRHAPEAIDLAADPYLKDVCRGALTELPFKRFTSYDFIYGSPVPVRVSGAYYEVRGKDAADAATVHDEIEATIFRDVEMVVEAHQTAPQFSFDRWAVAFAVSDHPFSAHRQLQHHRAMGATFPLLDLANLPLPDPANGGRPDAGGPRFSGNFISALNLLATRGENVWGRTDSADGRRKADQVRLATTGTEYERPLPISDGDLAALKAVPAGEKLRVSSRGTYILIVLGKPARFVAAINSDKNAVG
jgi:hypothetical protein